MKRKVKRFLLVILIIGSIIIINEIDNIIAYASDFVRSSNNFTIASGEVSSTSAVRGMRFAPSNDRTIIGPGDDFSFNKTYYNSGNIKEYIRIQVLIPMDKVKYVDFQNNIVEPENEVELINLKEENDNWELVENEGFSNTIQKDNKKYKLYTYKYIQDGTEKIFSSGENLNFSLNGNFINYVNSDSSIDFDVFVDAISIQSQGPNGEDADTMWTYYLNQTRSF